MIQNPKAYWQNISAQVDWRDHILPGRSEEAFDYEGWIEAQRLFYFFDKSSVVVDYGCGVGRILQYVARKAGYTVGLDISQIFLDRAKELIKSDKVGFFRSDEYQTENIADFVYCLMVMQHNSPENQRKIMNHIFRILRKGRTAIISFPKADSAYYQESETLYKFKKEEAEVFGKMFASYRIVEGNYPNYEKAHDKSINHEYYLIAIK